MARIAAALVGFLAGALPVAAQTVDSLARLGEQVHQGDRVTISIASGTTVSGRVTRLTPEAVTLDTVPAGFSLLDTTVRQVAVRHRSARRGALAGAAAGALALAIPECNGDPHDQCGEGITMGVLLGGAFGAIAGAFIPHTVVVFRAGDAAVSVAPLLGGRAIGVAAGLRW